MEESKVFTGANATGGLGVGALVTIIIACEGLAIIDESTLLVETPEVEGSKVLTGANATGGLGVGALVTIIIACEGLAIIDESTLLVETPEMEGSKVLSDEGSGTITGSGRTHLNFSSG